MENLNIKKALWKTIILRSGVWGVKYSKQRQGKKLETAKVESISLFALKS